LNENARALLPRVTTLVDRALDLQQFWASERGATDRVAASVTVWEYLLPQRVAHWKQKHPMSRIQTQIRNTSDALTAAAGFSAKVGFVDRAPTHADPDSHPG